jgi:thymidylate synthase (FAD)
VGPQSTTNRQGRLDTVVPVEAVETFLGLIKADREAAYSHYQQFVEDNIARELARIVLPLSLYSQFYWQINLHNLFHFLSLRLDSHAQKETRNFAEQIGVCTRAVAPIAWEAFEEYKLYGKTFSRSEIAYIKKLLSGERLPYDVFEGSKSLMREFEEKLGMDLTNETSAQ